MTRIGIGMVAIAAAAMMLLPAVAASAATRAGVFQGCQFQACNMNTAECCRLAARQEAACRATDAANRPNYSAHGKSGAKAKKAISECTRCSQVFLQTFCSRK